ncbi:16S rRNA (cytosine(967)-C(5))-methyltransferase RsmB [Sneathiella aquimaris]|uniref:16S rRNA (cytosine(967)-C(5))-methyltransferase RsmB n=1 Tax=Sneathiella aquimaris TaxID=2599305 RepID=UPI00146E200C|nr:16S rRNA (cytosine(967)-C(5))-methyltransferase RsmB [Sneathiella aquimaris]
MSDETPNPRARAVRMLVQVLGKNRQLEDVLPEGLNNLAPKDRALARALTSTTLRHLGIIDYLTGKMLDRPLPQKADNIRQIIRIGLAQILYLNIPPHAAVHDTVELVPANSKFRGLVNALLRRADRQGAKLLAKMDLPRSNMPAWIWNSWKDFYGEEKARDIILSQLIEAPLDITVKSEPDQWAQKLEATLLPTGSLRRKAGGSVPDLAGFDEGQWWVQDAAAAIPAQLFPTLAGKRILDLCAAPGGKTAQLASMGADVVALDRSKARLKRLQENMDRLNLSVTVAVADGTSYAPDDPFDGILLDAPCSSTGTIRRHPDVAWLKKEEDVKKLADLQLRLLDATIPLLKSGGTLIYSTCSLQPEEGEYQIASFLERHPEMKRQPVEESEVGGLAELLTKEGDIRCLPCHLGGTGQTLLTGMDGFYACRMKKD